MRNYFDTSALCRYYHTEPGSPEIERIVAEPGGLHVISWLTVLEAQSAFALKVRTGEIADSDFLQLRRRLKADIGTRQWPVVRVLRRHFDEAERLLVQYSLSRRLRSLDALHLGIALDLRRRDRIDSIVTADQSLVQVAQLEGLLARDPLHP